MKGIRRLPKMVSKGLLVAAFAVLAGCGAASFPPIDGLEPCQTTFTAWYRTADGTDIPLQGQLQFAGEKDTLVLILVTGQTIGRCDWNGSQRLCTSAPGSRNILEQTASAVCGAVRREQGQDAATGWTFTTPAPRRHVVTAPAKNVVIDLQFMDIQYGTSR